MCIYPTVLHWAQLWSLMSWLLMSNVSRWLSGLLFHFHDDYGEILQKHHHQRKKWKSARILASVSEQNLQFRKCWATVITKATPSLLISICLDLDLSLSFSTLEFLMNLLWAKPKKLETYRTPSLSQWFWVQTHFHRKSCENTVRHWKKQFFSAYLQFIIRVINTNFKISKTSSSHTDQSFCSCIYRRLGNL